MPTRVDVVQFADGTRMRVPDGMDPHEFGRRHQAMALSEGRCPLHPSMSLAVVDGDSAYSPGSGRPWYHHDGCMYYWQLGPEPHTFTCEVKFAFEGWDPWAPVVLT